jgi:hypothetical protein
VLDAAANRDNNRQYRACGARLTRFCIRNTQSRFRLVDRQELVNVSRVKGTIVRSVHGEHAFARALDHEPLCDQLLDTMNLCPCRRGLAPLSDSDTSWDTTAGRAKTSTHEGPLSRHL